MYNLTFALACHLVARIHKGKYKLGIEGSLTTDLLGWRITSVVSLSDGQMGKKRKRAELTQDEVWDDSALLRSWQDALEEYQVCRPETLHFC